MINKHQPHLLVLPEDDHDRQIADGFALHTAVNPCKIQVLSPAGGWMKALKCFAEDHQDDMRRFQERRLAIVIDFDERDRQREHAQKQIPDDLRNRVFILGSRNEPKDLKKAMRSVGSLERIGTALADDCHTGTHELWNHPELVQNADELRRLKTAVEPWLFY